MPNTDHTPSQLKRWRKAVIASKLDTSAVNALLASNPSLDDIDYMLTSGFLSTEGRS